MTLHKLTAGSGYDYLTRQVAALDATDKGHTGLATYYSERGETPGVWVGTGMADIDGLQVGDAVTAKQMKALFGAGMHPVDGTLGQPLKANAGGVSDFRVAVARAVAEVASSPAARAFSGSSPDAGEPGSQRGERRGEPTGPDAGSESDGAVLGWVLSGIRTRVAVEMFTAQHNRAPTSLELSDWVAVHTRVTSTAVAGFDLTFSPVKSVSTLWAVADLPTAALVEQAHQTAVREALAFIEQHALFSRTGRGGIRQVEVTGLVATAFTHRDSRAGDPDLHTHVAVANKVFTRPADGSPGSWLSIDGRAIYKAATAASEVYNTSLEHHLTRLLGVRFAERDPGALNPGGKRGVREIVGIDPVLNQRWSRRRAQIEDRQGDLSTQFRARHGRPPTTVEAIHLAQQANLETRDAKHSARSLTEQRASWSRDAIEVMGSPDAIAQMVHRVLSPATDPAPAVEVTEEWVDRVARQVVGEIEQRRATWQLCHVQAETQRQLRTHHLAPDDTTRAFEAVTHAALATHSVSLAAPTDAEMGIVEPASLRRSDGTSVYEVAGKTRHSSTRILAAEARLLTHGAAIGAPVVPHGYVDLALAEAAAHGTPLNPGQAELVREMATSHRRLQVAIAPAGTGKTTALRALATAWSEAGGQVLALAPSAAAADVLTDALPTESSGGHCDTLAKLTHTLDHTDLGVPAWVSTIGPSTLLVIDEAGMADTPTLDTAVTHALNAGATVRLLGDDQQLAAIGAGGILRDLAHHHGALRLKEVMRFTDPAEARATTQLRVGAGLDQALSFYFAHDRVHVADHTTVARDVHAAWAQDRARGLDSLMVAPTRTGVRDLNQLAQASLRPQSAGSQPRPVVALADGLAGGVGDIIRTRRNNRCLTYTDTDWVKNGDTWTITQLRADGSLTARNARNGLTTRLPADYVAASVELGYATTIHGAQGTTVDTLHGLLTGQETRQDLYTMLSRGRHANHVYLTVAATTGSEHDLVRPAAFRPETARETLTEICLRDGTATSATTELTYSHDPATRHEAALARYYDALTHACEHVLGPEATTAIETTAAHLIPDITNQPAWPTLRASLIRAAADDHDPRQLLLTALQRGPIDTTHDPIATLDWRITTLAPGAAAGAIPARVARHPTWATYLTIRAHIARAHRAPPVLSTATEITATQNWQAARTPSVAPAR